MLTSSTLCSCLSSQSIVWQHPGSLNACILGRRAPAAAHTVRSRLPLGTPRENNNLPHSHIQVIPRPDTEFDQNNNKAYDNRIPTFRSSSLQFSSPFDRQLRFIGDTTAESSCAESTTFADMARRSQKKDNKIGGEQPISLAGIIKLQPNRSKKGNKAWRPMKASDLGENESDGLDANDSTSVTAHVESLLHHSTPTDQGFLTRFPFDLSQIQSAVPSRISPASVHHTASENHLDAVRSPGLLTRTGGEDNSLADTHSDCGNNYELVFGKLPDPIRLHEQMGEFDGQVVFIGHPNRDVSAHQWSSTSFQWVNIGRYAHLRGRVEGSLASDRLRGLDTSHNSLRYFKLAAEDREKLIVKNGRPKEASLRPSLTDADRMASLSSVSSLASEPAITKDNGVSNFSSEVKTTIPTALHTTIRREYLEDPFVSVRPFHPEFSINHEPRGNNMGPTGSLDFGYEFPSKPGTPPVLVCKTSATTSHQNLYVQRERECLETIHRTSKTYEHSSQPKLREVGFGEEAASGFTISAGYNIPLERCAIPSSPEDIVNRQKLRSKLAELGEQASKSSVSTQGRITIPNFANPQASVRLLFPPPGLTVANPHRIVSKLNATALPYANLSPVTTISPASESEATTVNANATALQFSDPDGLRQTQEYEIANGLSQQPPTKQCFRGPFFTDTKPTAHDPTVLLSVQVDEEEKLMNWFRDGQRPARQREYAKTLVSAAAASSKSRSVGTIGEYVGPQRQDCYENTLPFVRLYEVLSEYVEEHRTGNGKSYFTRAWKAGPLALRDFGSDSNNSYFSKLLMASSDRARYLQRTHLEPNNHAWEAFGSFLNPTRARYS